MDLLNIRINLIKYLDITKDLITIEEKALSYKAQFLSLKQTKNVYISPLKLNLVINLSLLSEIEGVFAELIINDPDEAYDLLCNLIVMSINVLTNWDIDFKMIHLFLRLDTLPDLPQLKLNWPPPKGLFNIQGILISRSTPTKYLISTMYECIDETCPGNRAERVFDESLINKCEYCGHVRIEIRNTRVTADHVTGVFLPKKFLDSSLEFKRCQGINIDFKAEDLYSQLELGIQYNIVVKRDRKGFTAWGLKPMLPESLVRALKNYTPAPFPQSIAEVFTTLREICGTSPWTFVSFLASQISISIYPVSSFMQLKTGLLLSLASTQGRKCPTSILALGECSSIMSNAARLCPRTLAVTPSLCTPPSGMVSVGADGACLEAGPLLLASYGVFNVGNLPKIGSKFLSQIASAVDSELVTLQQKPGCCTVDPKILTYPLKSAIWMQWKCNKYSWQDMHDLRTLIDVFGMPFLAEIGCDDETISYSIINNAIGNDDYEEESMINEEDFREFIGIVSAQEVEISDEAGSLIKNYFVASRRERPDSLPIKAVKVLTAMCEAHARLSFRNVATYEDAVAAIFLYEESVVALFGKSIMSEVPLRNCNATASFDVVKEMDLTLNKFSKWLDSYVNNQHTSETSTQSSNFL